ncbi:MAG TPA: hypothetical protein VFQ43_02655 [Nitrososphaera sp.]|nr:hypothetical protein [Nitrososphaera sp.]
MAIGIFVIRWFASALYITFSGLSLRRATTIIVPTKAKPGKKRVAGGSRDV